MIVGIILRMKDLKAMNITPYVRYVVIRTIGVENHVIGHRKYVYVRFTGVRFTGMPSGENVGMVSIIM